LNSRSKPPALVPPRVRENPRIGRRERTHKPAAAAMIGSPSRSSSIASAAPGRRERCRLSGVASLFSADHKLSAQIGGRNRRTLRKRLTRPENPCAIISPGNLQVRARLCVPETRDELPQDPKDLVQR
jgi:hypothetical protein